MPVIQCFQFNRNCIFCETCLIIKRNTSCEKETKTSRQHEFYPDKQNLNLGTRFNIIKFVFKGNGPLKLILTFPETLLCCKVSKNVCHCLIDSIYIPNCKFQVSTWGWNPRHTGTVNVKKYIYIHTVYIPH